MYTKWIERVEYKFIGMEEMYQHKFQKFIHWGKFKDCLNGYFQNYKGKK